MPQRYHVVPVPDSQSAFDARKLANLLATDSQLLLPMLDLIEQAEAAIDELIDVIGRATIEAVLLMSAAQLAGPKSKARRPTGMWPITVARPGGSPSRSVNFTSKSHGCGRRTPGPESWERLRSPVKWCAILMSCLANLDSSGSAKCRISLERIFSRRNG
jgi:hypothetical protein